jgi:hypothetical protein
MVIGLLGGMLDTKTDVWVIKFSEAGKLRADIALFTDTTRNIVGQLFSS